MSEPDLRTWIDEAAKAYCMPAYHQQVDMYVEFGRKVIRQLARRARQQADWHGERANDVGDLERSICHNCTEAAFNKFADSLEGALKP